MNAPKILALQFKYFGDAVLMTPALRALRQYFPDAALHLLVPEEIAPLFQNLPWLDRVWAMPRKRGSANFGQTWPLIRALRRERFDRSVDFASNDRGAILSFLIGAKRRLGWAERGGFFGRKFFYNDRVAPKKNSSHESARLAWLLSGWEIPPPDSFEAEIHPAPAFAETAKKILPDCGAILCHVASSQPKKEWPLASWAELNRLARAAGQHLVFTTASGEREAGLTVKLKEIAPDAVILPQITELPLFLAVLSRAGIFISGDTGPLHFAAGLGVPTIGLFGPTAAVQWKPVGSRHQIIQSSKCDCRGSSHICYGVRHCMADISPEEVFRCLQKLVASK